MTDLHRWFRSRVLARAAGLLDEDEERRFDEHEVSCPVCRELHDALHELDEDEAHERTPEDIAPGHLPTAILARWHLVREHLPGMERDLVLTHATHCPDCRDELRALGVEVEAPERPSVRPREGGWRPGSFVPWLAGGLVGAAAALLVLLVVQEDSSLPSGLVPWGAPTEVRGDDPVRVPSGGRTLVLAIPPPASLPASEGGLVEVIGPGGALLLRDHVSAEMLRQPTIMLLLTSRAPLSEGEYTIVFRAGTLNAPREEAERQTFRVRTVP